MHKCTFSKQQQLVHVNHVSFSHSKLLATTLPMFIMGASLNYNSAHMFIMGQKYTLNMEAHLKY